MTNSGIAVSIVLGALLGTGQAFSQDQAGLGQGQVVVTVLPKHDGDLPAGVANQDLSVKVDGKSAKVTRWVPYLSPANSMELVLLIDDSSHTNLGSQLDAIRHFIKTLPPNTKAAVAYMDYGRAVFSAPLTADHEKLLSELHLPGGPAGSSASPYFCLSDLAKHWPSNDPAARREVVMVTDGVDYYQMGYDPDDPYVNAAIADSVRARLVVYSIYWRNRGRADGSEYENNAGQNLLSEVTEATGGKNFWTGMGNPVAFDPFLDELTRRFRNQYELGFVSSGNIRPGVETLKLHLSAPGTEIDAPEKVLMAPFTPAQN
jgi:hypothetical protein